MDEDRRKWTQYLYGVDWTDPSLYDLIVNLEYVDAQDAVDGIAHIVRNQACFDFDVRCQAMMRDLAVASRVRADLALSPAMAHLEFEVTSQDGQVAVKGKLPDIKLVDEVRRIALAAPGVESVSLSEVTAPTVA
jgi:hypothetical protein